MRRSRGRLGYLLIAALVLAVAVLAGCAPAATAPAAGGQPGAVGAPTGRQLSVVTTVAPLTDIVQHVGGTRINLRGLIPEGADSHTFEPAPSDVRLLAEADLIVLNGLNLEVPTEKLARANKKASAVILKLGDNTIARQEWIYDFSFPESAGNPNPHLWMNVAHAMKYAELARDALIQLDPANRDYYQANTQRYLALLAKLDQAILAAVQTIPPQHRKLLTYHDSFAYFAARYGLRVIGAIQPADFSEPSPRDVAALIEQLKHEQVPAIFGSEVFPSKVLEQIYREAGVKFLDTLRDDDLPGPKDAPEHSYVGMMLEDVRTMVTALGGRAEPLRGVTSDGLGQVGSGQ